MHVIKLKNTLSLTHPYKKIIVLLLLIYVCVQCYCLQQLSVNYDEGLFAGYGVTILKMQGEKNVLKYDSQLPITAINMLPRAVEQIIHPGLKKTGEQDIVRGRYLSLLAAVILALTVYSWSSRLYGEKAGLFSFIIFLICPNFLAHGVFVSSDIFASLFMALSFFFLWRFSQNMRVQHFLLTSCFVALAQVSKYSMVHLLLLVPVLLIAWFFLKRRVMGKQNFKLRGLVYWLFLFAAINWFVISAAHLFYGMFIPLNDYQFRSDFFIHFQQFFSTFGKFIPVPLPKGYVQSMDMVIYLENLGAGKPGSSQGAFYIAGHSSMHGFWYYYMVVFLYKLPLPLLALLLLSVIFYCKKWDADMLLKNEIYLLVPVLYFFVYMNFFYSTQIGIRHIIIILPLLYVFIGFLFCQMQSVTRMYICYGLVICQFVSVFSYFPHFLPYTNELIIDKKMVYKKIADTNICYGEGRKYLEKYLSANPGAIYMPGNVVPGMIVMEINEMLDLDISTVGKYDWVSGLIPVDHIHSQYLVFNVSKHVADSLNNRPKLIP
jgi:hypothetical protein